MVETRERSLGELFSALTRDTGTLIRKEIELAQVELAKKVSVVGRRTAVVALGAAVAYAGVLVGMAGLVAALVATGLSPAVAALIIGVVVFAVGALLVRHGLSALRRSSLVPEETVRTVRETTEWVKSQRQ